MLDATRRAHLRLTQLQRAIVPEPHLLAALGRARERVLPRLIRPMRARRERLRRQRLLHGIGRAADPKGRAVVAKDVPARQHVVGIHRHRRSSCSSGAAN